MQYEEIKVSNNTVYLPKLGDVMEHYFKNKDNRDKFIFYYLSKNDQIIGEEVVINYDRDDLFCGRLLLSLLFYKASKVLILKIVNDYEQLPTQFDKMNFERVKMVMKNTNVELKDYFILSGTDYYSFLTHGKRRKKRCA